MKKRDRWNGIRAAALLLAVVITLGTPVFAAEFTDVPQNHWAYGAISEASADGVVKGVGNNRFNPDGSITLAHITVILTRMLYPSEVNASSATGAWWAKNAEVANHHHFFQGLNNTDMDHALTREELACILYNATVNYGSNYASYPFGALDSTLAKIPDAASVDPLYQYGVAFCYLNGCIQGVDKTGRFSPKSPLTRAQTAVIYVRYKDALMTPVEQPEAPAQQPETTVEQPETPVEQPETPVEQPEAPVEQPETPVEQPEAPVEQPETPVEQPETPVEQPETPVEQPETPVEQPETPVEQPETPVEQPETPAQQPETPEELTAEVARLVNEERSKEGLPPLGTYDSLTEAAQIRAPEIASLFSHDRPDGDSCFTALRETGASENAYTMGENIAAGSSTAAGVMDQWMNSPGHRANIMNPDFTHIGVGYYQESGGYRYYWVQMFVGRVSGSD